MKKIFILITISFFGLQAMAQFVEEQQILQTATGELKGSLYIPSYQGKRIPVLILQPGSGPTDRYGNNPLGVNADSYKMIAEGLIKYNIATLLIDKRGIAASADAGKDESKLLFTSYVTDLEAWVKFLKNDKRLKNITIAGHSEGALVGMLAAEKIKKLNGYISIAGPGENIATTLVKQVTAQSASFGQQLDSLLSLVKAYKKIEPVTGPLASLLRPSILPYMQSWMQYDPSEEIKKLKTRVLIIQGGTDIQVSVADAKLLQAARPEASFLLIDSMNHILKIAPIDRQQNQATYNIPTLPLAPELLPKIVNFINRKD